MFSWASPQGKSCYVCPSFKNPSSWPRFPHESSPSKLKGKFLHQTSIPNPHPLSNSVHETSSKHWPHRVPNDRSTDPSSIQRGKGLHICSRTNQRGGISIALHCITWYLPSRLFTSSTSQNDLKEWSMSPSSPPSNSFCGLHRPSAGSNSKKTAHQVVLNAKPLLLRRRDSSTTVSSSYNVRPLYKKSGKQPAHDHHQSQKPNENQDNHNTKSSLPVNNNNPKRRSADFQWAGEDQLSVILELLDESRSTPGLESSDPLRTHYNPHPPPLALPIPETISEQSSPTPSPRTPEFLKIGVEERAYRIPPHYSNRPPNKRSQRSLESQSREEDTKMASSTSERDLKERSMPETPIPRPIASPPKDVCIGLFPSSVSAVSCVIHFLP